MSASQTIDNDADASVDNRNEEGVNTDMNSSTKPGNNPQLIVNALLTFIISLLHSAASANRLVEIICKFYDNDEIKNAKCLLCDVSNMKYENRQDSAKRTEKTAHAFDIVEILKKLDKNKEIPTFVIDSFDLAKLPRINTEDITYVSVAEKVAELDAKINLMNDAIASNTVRSTNNSDTIKSIMSSITPEDINISRDVRHSKYHAPNIHSLRHSDCQPSGSAEPTTRTVVTSTSSPSNTRSTRDVINDSITITTSSSAKTTMSEVVSRNCDPMTNPLRDPRYNMPSRDSSGVRSIVHSSSNISISNEIPGDWKQPRRSQRRRPHVNEICGVRNGSKIKGAPRPRWNMFISKVSKETDDKEMKNFIELLQVTVLELVRVSHDDSVYKSFKLTVYPEDYKKIYDPHLWPAGVCIRKYRLPNSIPESKAD